jgi:hypothetical protein
LQIVVVAEKEQKGNENVQEKKESRTDTKPRTGAEATETKKKTSETRYSKDGIAVQGSGTSGKQARSERKEGGGKSAKPTGEQKKARDGESKSDKTSGEVNQANSDLWDDESGDEVHEAPKEARHREKRGAAGPPKNVAFWQRAKIEEGSGGFEERELRDKAMMQRVLCHAMGIRRPNTRAKQKEKGDGLVGDAWDDD